MSGEKGATGWCTDVEEGAVARHVLSALRHSELDLLQAERRGGMPVGLDTVRAQDVDRLDLVLEPALDQAVDILHQEAEEPANQNPPIVGDGQQPAGQPLVNLCRRVRVRCVRVRWEWARDTHLEDSDFVRTWSLSTNSSGMYSMKPFSLRSLLASPSRTMMPLVQ